MRARTGEAAALTSLSPSFSFFFLLRACARADLRTCSLYFFGGSHLSSHAHMAMATARNVQRGMELLPRLTSTPDNRMPAARTRRHLAELPGVGCRRPPLPLLPMQTRRWHDSRKGARKGLSPLPVLSARYR